MAQQTPNKSDRLRIPTGTDTVARRFEDYRHAIALPPVDIVNPSALSHEEMGLLKIRVAASNFAVYRCTDPQSVSETDVLALCRQVGMRRLDNNPHGGMIKLTRIEVSEAPLGRYIPYTDSEMSWHTDGYYNPEQRRICGMMLHCVRAATRGGETELIDHEIIYALLEQADPAYVVALSRPDAMTIPRNSDAPNGHRNAQRGPVFWWCSGRLYMRYTARRRNIEWRDDPLTRKAVIALEEILHRRHDLIFHRRLRPGEGVLCNNTLHRRRSFRNDLGQDQQRLFYRGRFHAGIDISMPGGEVHHALAQ